MISVLCGCTCIQTSCKPPGDQVREIGRVIDGVSSPAALSGFTVSLEVTSAHLRWLIWQRSTKLKHAAYLNMLGSMS
jgi:hypothetical protein